MASGAEVRLYAEDGTYLGKAGASRFDPESIDNPFGEYGSKFSATSINNRFSPYWRGNVGIIPRPAESSGAAFNRGFQQGYDSTARLAQQRREYAEENERWLRERQEQRARDAELAAIEEQTREIRELREALEEQRYELEAQRYQQQAPATPKKKETYRNGSPFSDEFLISIGYLKEPVEDGETQQAKPETAEEKAARLKEEGRREWEAIKAQWAAEDARKGK
jgi:HD superfamily phosphohydrolase